MLDLIQADHIAQIVTLEEKAIKTHKLEGGVISDNRKAVFYSDGGYRMATHLRTAPPPVGGYGLFGFLWVPGKPKKGHGCSGFTPTDCGLVNNYELGKEFGDAKVTPTEVTVVAYMESMGATFDCASNNVAEVEGIYAALSIAKQLDIKDILIISDSRYALQGLWKHCANWCEQGWLKEGKPRPNAAMWERVYTLFKELQDKGVVIKGEWVKGHQDNKGNIEADRLAGLSMNACTNGITDFVMTVTDPSDQWNPKVNIHPMITESRFYYDAMDDTNIYNGHSFFYMADPKKLDEDQYGKASSDMMMTCLAMRNPDPVLQTLWNTCSAFKHYNKLSVFIGRLDLALRPANYQQILVRGLDWFRSNPHRIEIQLPCKTPILRQMPTLNHGNSGMAEMRSLRDMLVSFMDGKAYDFPHHVVNDVTDQIYKTVTTKKGDVLEPVMAVNDKTLNLDVTWDSPQYGRMKDKVSLAEAVAVPRFRHFKHFTTLTDLKCYVITVREGIAGYRYFFIVSTSDAVGIWAGVYSNRKTLLIHN